MSFFIEGAGGRKRNPKKNSHLPPLAATLLVWETCPQEKAQLQTLQYHTISINILLGFPEIGSPKNPSPEWFRGLRVLPSFSRQAKGQQRLPNHGPFAAETSAAAASAACCSADRCALAQPWLQWLRSMVETDEAKRRCIRTLGSSSAVPRLRMVRNKEYSMINGSLIRKLPRYERLSWLAFSPWW